MNFQGMGSVINGQELLDICFSKAKKKAELSGQKRFQSKLVKMKALDNARINSITSTAYAKFTIIIESFPSFDNLPEFYNELAKATLDYDMVKKSLGAILWAKNKINSLGSSYSSNIQRTKEDPSPFRRGFYGRFSSLVKQINPYLVVLENARQIMKDYPTIKTSLFTVAICGFPNVGKTTLLSKMTSSEPEISNYSFTTKGVNVSYIHENNKRFVQVLDTPGTLNRFEKMNSIEKQADIAIRLSADVLIYVFDLSEPYPMDSQIKLYDNLKNLGKEIFIYLSKTDVLNKEIVNKFSFSHSSIDELKSMLVSKAREKYLSEKEQEEDK